jgi:DNA-binding MarR family transcriptional regulator
MKHSVNKRVTGPKLRVYAALLHAPDHESYGKAIATATRLESATVSRILRDMEQQGWTRTREEHGAAFGTHRRYYQLTDTGRAAIARILAERQVAQAPKGRIPMPQFVQPPEGVS